MKKLLALLLSLLMVFSMATLLSSCGDSDDSDDSSSSSVSEEKSSKSDKKDDSSDSEEKTSKKKKSTKSSDSDEDLIIGEWEMTIDYAEIINAQMEESGEDLPFDVDVDDAEISMFWTFDNDGLCTLQMDKKSFEKFYDSYIEKILDQISDDPDERAELKEEMKSSIEEDEFEPQTGEYSIKNGKLYIENDEGEEEIYTYKFVNDDEIKITDIEGDDSDGDIDFSAVLPLVLKRK